MDGYPWNRHRFSGELAVGEVTGAVGDSITVLPIVVGVALLTELSPAVMLLWFGLFQIVWGLYYGVPLSVEPMKALAGLVVAGAISTGELLVAGLAAGVVLLGIGATGTLSRIEQVVGEPVVRGIQLAVALLLLETGVGLGLRDPLLAGAGAAIALLVVGLGYWNLSALAVLVAGGAVAVAQTGLPAPALPAIEPLAGLSWAGVTANAAEATVAQLGMTIGNAAVATSLLVSDFFDRDVSPDELATSMGVMNLVSVPLGGLPMCHGSGGVAGKYTFGARTAVANLVLGVGYVALALGAVGVAMAYPLSVMGVVLVLIALQLARTSLQSTSTLLVVTIGLLGAVANVGIAFVAGSAAYVVLDRLDRT